MQRTELPGWDRPLAQIVVLERDSFWGPELKRHFQSASINSRRIVVRETRRVVEVSVSHELPRANTVPSRWLAVIVPGDDFPDALISLPQWRRDPHCLGVAVIASLSDASCEWLARELGASTYFIEPVNVSEVVQTCERLIPND